MRILITAATKFEVQPIIDFFDANAPKFPGHQILFFITGAGAVATAYELTKEIQVTRPAIVLQAGIAGGYEDYTLTETVIVKEDCLADLGVSENGNFKTVFDLGLADKNSFPFLNGVLANPNKKLMRLLPLPNVNAVTVNEITTRKERAIWYKQNYSPVIESMEGAAFHYVCLREKISFLQIRSISNYIGERNKSQWKLKEAIIVLNEQLTLLIEEIVKHDEAYFRI
ncbi:MAG: futalosine hydrolase [Bacteroidetes bacterium]|nr:futalosine hydrolase [Bacteroidota bacterium]